MHEVAAEYFSPLISSIPLQFHNDGCFNFVEPLWYSRSRSRSDEKGENQIWLEKQILIAIQLTIELVVFLDQERGRHVFQLLLLMPC
jgi:hypothetical protein